MGHHMLTLYLCMATKVKAEQCKLEKAARECALSLTQTDICGSHRQMWCLHSAFEPHLIFLIVVRT